MTDAPKNMKALLLSYLERHKTAAVATVGVKNDVNAATVYYSYDQHGHVYFGANDETTKARHIRVNPQIALTMDDGGTSAMGVQIKGQAVKLTGPDADPVKAMLMERHSAAAAFYELPGVVYYRVEASSCFLINFAWGMEWRKEVCL